MTCTATRTALAGTLPLATPIHATTEEEARVRRRWLSWVAVGVLGLILSVAARGDTGSTAAGATGAAAPPENHVSENYASSESASAESYGEAAPPRILRAGTPTPATASQAAASQAAAALTAVAEPAFEEVAREAGIDFEHVRPMFDDELTRVMTWMTSINAGVAAADYDFDGDVDFYALRGRRGTANGLFRNEGGFRFVDVAEASGAAFVNDDDGVSMDTLFADFDNDGDQDIYIAAYGRNRLLINDGGRFTEAGESAGLSHHGNSSSVVTFDYDQDGLLDLMVGNYFDHHDLWNIPGPKILQTNFQRARNGGTNFFYRNNGDGTFTEKAEALGLDDSGWALALGAGDLDNDGDVDVYLANDYGYDRIYRNEGDGSFTDISSEATGGDDTDAGMNVDFGDFDNDGNLDIYVTNITNKMMPQGNMLWQNLGEMVFMNQARFTRSADGGWGWGGKFLDFDNDGDLDIFTVNGYVSDGPVDLFKGEGQLNKGDVSDIRGWPDMRGLSLSGYEKSRLFINDKGRFREAAEAMGVADDTDGRGIAVADVDSDGDLDMFVANCGQPAALYRNETGNQKNWIEVELIGSEGNRDAIGARLTLTAGGETQIREVDGGNGFSGQSSRIQHFGLGLGGRVESLEIRWPNGKRQRFEDLTAGNRLVITE